MDKLIELVEGVISLGIVSVFSAIILGVLAKLDWGGWFSKLLDKRIKESLAKNQASLDNKLYCTKVLFDIEIEVLRGLCELMSTMAGDIRKINNLNTKTYLVQDQNHFEEIRGNITKSIDSMENLVEYQSRNSAFIVKDVYDMVNILILEAQLIIGTSISFAEEYRDKGFSNLDEIDVWFKNSNEKQKTYDDSQIYKNMRTKKFKLSPPFENDIAISIELINYEIREYISRLTIVE